MVLEMEFSFLVYLHTVVISTVLWVYVNIVVFLSSSVFVNSICLHLCHAVRKKMDRGRCHVRKWIEGAVVGVCFSRFSLLAVISYVLFSTVCQISSRAFYMGELGNYMTSSGTLTKKTPVSLRKFEFNFMKRKEQK